MFLTDQQMACRALRCLFICLFLIYGQVKACSRRKPPKSCIDKKINVHSPGRTSWCSPTKNTKDIFFEVDLAKQYLLCKVSTQGDSKYSFTKSYKVKLSSNRIQWRFYQNNDGTDKIFQGNNDSSAIVRHSLTATKRTRFVRFYPISFETNGQVLTVRSRGHKGWQMWEKFDARYKCTGHYCQFVSHSSSKNIFGYRQRNKTVVLGKFYWTLSKS